MMSINIIFSMTQPLLVDVIPLTKGEPRSTQNTLVALRMHPSSGEYGMSLFDELVYTSLISDYQEEEEEEEGGLNQIQPVLRDTAVHLQSISDSTTTSSI